MPASASLPTPEGPEPEASPPAAVPFLDLAAAQAELAPELLAACRRVIAGGRYVLGPEVEAFEAEFAAYIGTRHAVGVGSGLEALALSLRALGVGPGEEVLVPAMTYIATWLAVAAVGARPVPVDSAADGLAPDPAGLAAAITPRTRAVVIVHLYGLPADLAPLLAVAARHGLAVVEDAAQAHGARYRGRRVGGFGHAAGWSFYPSKNLGALGDGGAVTTDDAALAASLRRLRDYGASRKNLHEERAGHSRLDELQAAMLRVKLPRLEAWNARRRAAAARYREGLAGAPLTLPEAAAGSEPCWHLHVVRTPRRAALAAHLAAQGIATAIHYPTPPHRQPAFAELGLGEGALPAAERLHREVLSLPIGPHLAPAQQDRVIEAVHAFPG